MIDLFIFKSQDTYSLVLSLLNSTAWPSLSVPLEAPPCVQGQHPISVAITFSLDGSTFQFVLKIGPTWMDVMQHR